MRRESVPPTRGQTRLWLALIGVLLVLGAVATWLGTGGEGALGHLPPEPPGSALEPGRMQPEASAMPGWNSGRVDTISVHAASPGGQPSGRHEFRFRWPQGATASEPPPELRVEAALDGQAMIVPLVPGVEVVPVQVEPGRTTGWTVTSLGARLGGGQLDAVAPGVVSSVEIDLADAPGIGGEVRDAFGPRGGAVVRAVAAVGARKGRQVESRTNEAGRFHLVALPGDVLWQIEAESAGCSEKSVFPVVAAARRHRSEVGLRLDQACSLTGQVVAPDGSPVRNALLRYAGPTRAASEILSGADGRFVMDDLACGLIQVWTEAAGWANAAWSLSSLGEDPVRLVLEEARPIHGRVEWAEDGSPAAGVMVACWSVDGAAAGPAPPDTPVTACLARTDAAGWFLAEGLRSGPMLARALGRATSEAIFKPGEPVVLRLHRPQHVRFSLMTLEEESGHPVAWPSVWRLEAGSCSASGVSESPVGVAATVETVMAQDADCTLWVGAPGHDPVIAWQGKARELNGRALTAHLPRRRELRVRVEDESGRAIKGATLLSRWPMNEREAWTSDVAYDEADGLPWIPGRRAMGSSAVADTDGLAVARWPAGVDCELWVLRSGYLPLRMMPPEPGVSDAHARLVSVPRLEAR